jgi:hypothetical protein
MPEPAPVISAIFCGPSMVQRFFSARGEAGMTAAFKLGNPKVGSGRKGRADTAIIIK